MNNQELVQCFSDIAKEKNVDRTEIGTILEELFLTLIEKQYGDASNCSVIVNIDRGEIEIYQEKTIVEEVDDPAREIELEKARALEPDLEVGDTFIDVVDPSLFGRRLISTAKQFLSQRIRDVEKKYIFEDYFGRVGEIVIGDVRQVHRDNVYVHIDQCELRLPKEEQIETERYRRGDTIRAIIRSVEMTPKGPDIVISRSDNQFLAKLFEMEVPEIEDGIIEILSIARAPGQRSKIIVRSTDKRIDAVGACVGMRGSRIQAIVRELHGERIDVINHTSRSEVLISRALSPAKPRNLYIDDEKKYCVAVFDDEEMDSAVGKNYLNVRLAAEVTGYTVDAVKASEYGEAKKEEVVYLDQIDTL
ncbi:MAG: transcription termination factor NusA, partial [Fidelibacterota bacterium]